MLSAAAARRAAVAGSPIAHSLSPVLHRAAYADLGLAGWRYDAHEVSDAAGLGALLDATDATWAGLSLTMPLKRLVRPMLDSESATALAVGSVNTVVLGGGGRAGHNTDVAGLVAALGEAAVSRVEAGVVLGGGATAASAVAALGQLGCTSPQVVVRSPERAGELLAAGERLGVPVGLLPWSSAPSSLARADLVVSTVPASAAGFVVEAVDAAVAGGARLGTLVDVGYDPWPTPPAAAWRAHGGTAVGGFAMLLHQAVGQVRLMTGRVPTVEVMRAAGVAALADGT